MQAVLCGAFLIPLCAGIYLAAGSTLRSMHARQVSRELASMYSQGIDFANPTNKSVARQLLESADERGVVVLSRLKTVEEADCAATPGDCANRGLAVIVQRFVIGEADLRPSSLGMPRSIDPATGAVLNWRNDDSARVADAQVSLKPGESAYAVETYIVGPDERLGVYARSLY